MSFQRLSEDADGDGWVTKLRGKSIPVCAYPIISGVWFLDLGAMARVYNGDTGALPQRGPGAQPLIRGWSGVRAKPAEAERNSNYV